MPDTLIHEVAVKDLQVIPDERGMLMEVLRVDDTLFRKFGQVYFTTAYPGVIKGWHYHKLQWDYFTCIHGTAKLVLHDAREDSPTRGKTNEFFVGLRNPRLVLIPPLVYHGFACVGAEECIMLNVPTEPYNHNAPDEYRAPLNDPSIPYNWSRRDG